jgi:hypothetical protein
MRTAQIAAFGADSGGFRDGGVWPDNRYSQAALAEFEIQESTVEKGEKEFEYRGAVHWGFPRT